MTNERADAKKKPYKDRALTKRTTSKKFRAGTRRRKSQARKAK